GFQTYVPQRMRGFGGESKRPRSRDFTDFPVFGEFMLQRMPRRSKVTNAPQAVADVVYEDLGPANDEIRLFKSALKDLSSPPAEMHVAALNEALAGIPRERVRLHCCWGNNEGPHTHDIPLAEVFPVLCQARVGALSIEFANPRHQHEYAALKKAKLPPEFVLIPGV